MTMYQELIKKATDCPDNRIDDIEDYMRNIYFHSTLSWQTNAQLVKGAKESWNELQWMESEEGKAYIEKNF